MEEKVEKNKIEKKKESKKKTKTFFAEFRDFAMKGNVMNLAVGVIIGAAFQSVVNSLVQDILSPFIGLFIGNNFEDLSFTINDVPIKYGAFITALVNFVIMAFVVFLLVKALNKITSMTFKKAEEKVEETTKECPYCYSKIPIKATRCPDCTSMLTVREKTQ